MGRIWAVARHMIAEGLRMKIALIFIGVIVLFVPILPFAVAGDGLTLKSRIQSFLAYSLGLVSFLLSLLTVFLSCAALSNEIRNKQIILIACKPIPRWQFFAGKWLGISLINAGLLLGTGLTVWGFTWYLSRQPTEIPGDREAVQAEVLKARYGVKPEQPDFIAQVDERIRKLREQGRVENLSPDAERTLRREIESDLRTTWSSLGPQQWKQYTFKGFIVDREKGWLHLRVKPTTATGVDDLPYKFMYQAGDPNEISTLTEQQVTEIISKRVSALPIPASAVNRDGTLYVAIANMDARNSMTFEGVESLQVLYDIGSFHWNLLRALTVVWCRLAFVAVLGLVASSFLSFPVACMGTFVILLMAATSGYVAEAFDWTVRWRNPMDVWLAVWIVRTGWLVMALGAVLVCLDIPRRGWLATLAVVAAVALWVLAWWTVKDNAEYTAARSMAVPFLSHLVLPTLASDIIRVVPDFAKFNPVGNVVGGHVVTLMWVLQSIVVLVVFQGLILGIVGALIFTRREVAEVVV